MDLITFTKKYERQIKNRSITIFQTRNIEGIDILFNRFDIHQLRILKDELKEMGFLYNSDKYIFIRRRLPSKKIKRIERSDFVGKCIEAKMSYVTDNEEYRKLSK